MQSHMHERHVHVQDAQATRAEVLAAASLWKENTPAVEYLPATHSRQVFVDVAPIAVEYLPPSQAVHCEAPAVQTNR